MAFYSYTYSRAVSEVRPYVYVMVIKHEGQPVGFLPFQFAGLGFKLFRAAQPVGDYMTDYFGMVAEPTLRLQPKELLRMAGVCSLLFSHLDETQAAWGLTGEKPELGLRIELAAGADAYWAILREIDKRFVSDTERRERKLIAKCGPLRFVFNSPDCLDELINHKSHQYVRTGSADIFSNKWTRDLLYKLSLSSDPLCSGVMSVLYAGDTWVASHFGIRCKSLLHYWFPVYNPQLREFSPGRLLLKAIIGQSLDSGILVIDRGAGDSPAKRDFANAEHLYYRGMWMRPAIRSILFRLSMSVRWRVLAEHARN
jgi:CelD/BcsL family acetyltransferase involved in cellulose biosynthesis